MAKEKETYTDDEGESLLIEEKKFKKRKRAFRAQCPHCSHKGKGKTLLKQTEVANVFRCSRKGCGTKVDFRPYAVDDPNEREKAYEKLRNAADVVKNALEIVKHRAAFDGRDKRSAEILAFAAKTIQAIDTVPDLLASLQTGEGKKKNKQRKEQQRHLIEHGTGSIFGGGKKKHHSKW